MLAFEYRALAWPDGPLDAAKYFHNEILPEVRGAIAETGLYADSAALDPNPAALDSVVLILPAAGHEHRGWRLAAIQELAREAAPKRVNAIVGDDDATIRTASKWLAAAPGITGQLLAVG